MPTRLCTSLALLLALAGCPRHDDRGAASAAVAAAPPVPAPPTASPAPAAPAKNIPRPADTLDRETRARYRAALADGRALHRKGDYRAAMAAFERALAIDPDDPRALAELGWAAFFARDLDVAEARTRAALARTVDAGGKGSVLYNLGRIAEERGDSAEAVALYRQSLHERPNDTVRDRLARLDPAAVTVYDALTPIPLRGPFSTLEKFCAGHTTLDGESVPCDPAAPFPDEVYEGPTALPAGEGPILAARVLWAAGTTSPTLASEVLVHLAIRTAQGWFVGPPVGDIYNPGAFGIHASMKATALELEDLVAGGAPELAYRFSLDRYDSDLGLNEYESTTERALVVCGIGASGAPSCTGAITLEVGSERAILFPDQDEPGMKHEGLYANHYTLTATFAPDGQLALQGAEPLPESARRLLGAHPLRFP